MSDVQPRSRLGDILVGAGVITQAQLEKALAEQATWGGRLGQLLMSLGFVDERSLTSAVARQLDRPALDLDRAHLDPKVVQLLPLAFCERYGVMPLGVRRGDGRIQIACFDPTDGEVERAVARTTQLIPEVHLATASAIDRAIRKYYYGEAMPTPAPGDPRFTVTRNTMASAPAMTDRDLTERLQKLEEKVDRLTEQVSDLLARAGRA